MKHLLPLLLGLTACIETGTTPLPDDPGPLRDADLDDDTEATDRRAPTADAGEDRRVAPLTELSLDGRRSHDPQGLDLIPTWTLVSVPAGSSARLERADDFQPVLFPDVAGVYEVELVVTNSAGLRSKHADTVRIHAVPEDALYVQLTWDTDVDLDLHLVAGDTEVWGAGDCTWCNPTPSWGGEGVLADDPSLDWDVIDGFGPETITVPEPADGSYRVYVDVYGQGGLTACRAEGCPVTTATVDVYFDGARVHRSVATLEQAGELWQPLVLDWPAARIVEVDVIGWTDVDDCQLP